MSNLSHNWNGFPISQRTSDNYVCLTDMAKANGNKLVADYTRLGSSKEYILGLSSYMGIPMSQLILSVRGNFQDGTDQGTWAHKGNYYSAPQPRNSELQIFVEDYVADRDEFFMHELVDLCSNKFPDHKAQSLKTRLAFVLGNMGWKRDLDRLKVVETDERNPNGRPKRLQLSIYVKPQT
jgi:KilA-N domain